MYTTVCTYYYVFCFSLQDLSASFLILRRNQRYMAINVCGVQVMYPFLLSDFNEIEYSRQIFEKYRIIRVMKIRPVGAEFHADGQT